MNGAGWAAWPVGERGWQRIDVIAAAGLTAAVVGVGLGGSVAYALAGGVATATVAVRRRWPAAACVVALAGASAGHVAAPSGAGRAGAALVAVAFLLDLYAFGYGSATRPSSAGWWSAAVVLIVPLVLLVGSDASGVVDALASWAYVVGLPFAAGRAVAVRSALARVRAEENACIEREQQERIDLLTRSERARVARELHDIVAHSVSVMVIQAAAARNAAAASPDKAGTALGVVEKCGREGLMEMRQLVGVLRRPGVAGSDDLATGLAQVEALVERARAAGLAVDLAVSGERRRLAPGLDLAAYRVVQEALTNSVKHAGPTRARVGISYGKSALELDIADRGRGPGFTASAPGGGRGLIGLRERVWLYGGEVSAGPSPDGAGFRVHARIPINPAVPT